MIDAKLFNHIQNDFTLKGTYDLQGHSIPTVLAYLKHYINNSKNNVPQEYKSLINDTDYLLEHNAPGAAATITRDILNLPKGGKLLLSGGWKHKSNAGGHVMLYQIIRTDTGYDFTVINSGSGIDNHETREVSDKVVYSPSKTWAFPAPCDANELYLFIRRLLDARHSILNGNDIAMTPKIMYEQVLSTISYLQGKEKKSSLPIEYYTGGQLSGTCTQRVFHQYFKINSKSLAEYQRFIFGFKHFALFDYANACFSKNEPFTAAVAEQIRLAIENNLKILQEPGVFTEEEINKYAGELDDLKKELKEKSKLFKKPSPPLTPFPSYSLKIPKITPVEVKPAYVNPQYNNKYCAAPYINPNMGQGLLDNLARAIKEIKQQQSYVSKFIYLEKLLLALPLNENSDALFHSPFYSELHSVNTIKPFGKLQRFNQQMDEILLIINELVAKWFHGDKTPAFHHLLASALTLKMDIHCHINSSPSFMPALADKMKAILGAAENPFLATGRPELDRRMQQLRTRFASAKTQSFDDLLGYYNALIAQNSVIKAQLLAAYNSKYSSNHEPLHNAIKEKGLEAPFMVGEVDLKARKYGYISKHFNFEGACFKIHRYFYSTLYEQPNDLRLKWESNSLWLETPLSYENKSPSNSLNLEKHKYAIDKDSEASLALNTENNAQQTENQIQLEPMEDIQGRDYYHLRINSSLQLTLTIDYFRQHIAKLAKITNQRYAEANILQPGLLLAELNNPNFLPHFSQLIDAGWRFFAPNKQANREVLFFIRLDFLVSRYFLLAKDKSALLRLEALRQSLEQQIKQATDPAILYFLQRYLFLTSQTLIEADKETNTVCTSAFKAYFYIQNHKSPAILEDTSDSYALNVAIFKFQETLHRIPSHRITAIVQQGLADTGENLELAGEFPIFSLKNSAGKIVHTLDAHQGKLFSNGFAHGILPRPVVSHPLMQQLGLAEKPEGLISSDNQFITLPGDCSVDLFYRPNEGRFIVHKVWDIHGKKRYELYPLSSKHEAAKNYRQINNKEFAMWSNNWPALLLDGSMNFWINTVDNRCGLFTQNNIPIYAVNGNHVRVINQEGHYTPYFLKPLDRQWGALLNNFESPKFILCHASTKDLIIKLPRFNLIFKVELQAETKVLKLQETEEIVEKMVSNPIHADVAGIILNLRGQRRFLVPVARFYAVDNKTTENSALYPTVHDINGTIAQDRVTNTLKNVTSLWYFENSESTISFRLINNEPIADSSMAALYLAYLYLATNQPKKAWKALSDCSSQFGGLTGNRFELQLVFWICYAVPTRLEGFTDKVKRITPPYIACQLKALGLLRQFQQQYGELDIGQTIITPENSANTVYAKLQQEKLNAFIKSLSATIVEKYLLLQRMRRHLSAYYTLTPLECSRLLSNHQNLSSTLSDELARLQALTLQQQTPALLANEWHPLIVQTVAKHRTSLPTLKEINLSLQGGKLYPYGPNVFDAVKKLNEQTLTSKKFTARQLKLKAAQLVSSISEVDFLNNFTAYLQITRLMPNSRDTKNWQEWMRSFFTLNVSQDDITALQDKLRLFCINTLIAARYVPLSEQKTSIPYLCNILYRLLNYYEQKHIHVGINDNMTLAVLHKAIDTYQPQAIYAYNLDKNIVSTIYNAAPLPPHVALELEAVPQEPMLDQTGIGKELAARPKSQIEQLINRYNQITHNCQDMLSSPQTNEEDAGEILFVAQQEKMALACELVKQSDLIAAILSACEQTNPNADDMWEKALHLANQGPHDNAGQRQWQLALKSKKRSALKQSDLKIIYTRADAAYTLEKTGLDEEDASALHQLIHLALLTGIQQKVINHIITYLGKAQQSQKASDALPALALLAYEEIPLNNDPNVVIVQHEEGILLYPSQVRAIEAMQADASTGVPPNKALKRPMGEGKSTVVLPIMLNMNASNKHKGKNLMIAEVPSALLAMLYVDLNRQSQRYYGKPTYCFEFSRKTAINSEELKKLYQYFIEIMANKCSLITTGDSIRSLVLRYIELLHSNTRDEYWEDQVFWFDKILKIFNNQADVIFEEVHQALLFRRKLNYTMGSPLPLDHYDYYISNALALFSFIDSDFIINAPLLLDNYDWSAFAQKLAHRVLNDCTSPLYNVAQQALKKGGEPLKQKLINYLTDPSSPEPSLIEKASDAEKQSLGFFRQQISTLLADTLTRCLDTQYGSSHRANLPAIEYTLAIPYSGNNQPNENSRFAELVAINCSVQMMIIKGVSLELMIEHIAYWQTLSQQQLALNPGFVTLEQTPTAQQFAALVNNSTLNLSTLDTQNSQQMAEVHCTLRFNRAFIFELLQKRVLKQIHIDQVFSCNAFNHASIYRSIQGTSGTPSNYRLFPYRLIYDNREALGSDGYIIKVINDKQTPIYTVHFENIIQFLHQALSQSHANGRTRAIIDIRATFRGISNILVAQQLAGYILAHPHLFSQTIKQILYYNEEQCLCAIKISEPNKPILLNGSRVEEINLQLNSTPNERFTYYDQPHTLGANIIQAETANALILVNEKPSPQSLQDYLQGCARMRGLAQQQTIELIVPLSLANITRDELHKRLSDSEQAMIEKDFESAAKEQMCNEIWSMVFRKVVSLNSNLAVEKANLITEFADFFTTKTKTDLFQLYGRKYRKISVHYSLQEYKTRLLARVEGKLTSDEVEICNNNLQKIIDHTLPYCEKEICENNGMPYDRIEIEVSSRQVENQTTKQSVSMQLLPKLVITWEQKHLAFLNSDNWLILTDQALHLKNITPPSVFTPNLLVSKNYANVYFEQLDVFTTYLKPVFLLWYFMHKGQLHAMIITPEEAKELIPLINADGTSWLTNTMGSAIAGKNPQTISQQEEYQVLREQVRFFNGELTSLLSSDTPLCWLIKDSAIKFAFYERKLLPFRSADRNTLEQLKALVRPSGAEGFIYISRYPYSDLASSNWQSMFPQASAEDIIAYQKLAKAFIALNKDWDNQAYPNLDSLLQEIHLPSNLLPYVSKHIRTLKYFKRLVTILQQEVLSEPFLLQLSTKQLDFLSHCLGESFNNTYQKLKNATADETQKEWQKFSFETLFKLQIHPAFTGKNYIKDYIRAMVCNAGERNTEAVLLMLDYFKQGKTAELPQLSFDSIVALLEKQSDVELDLLLQGATLLPLSQEQLTTLADKVTKGEHIEFLLKQETMTSDIAKKLWQKEGYNNKIANWSWLTEEQLLHTLNHSKDMDSIYCALKHANLSTETIETWLENLNLQQKLAKQQLVDNNHQQQLDYALNALKLKAFHHAVHSLKLEKHQGVARTSFKLYQDLSETAESFYQDKRAHPLEFKERCTSLIEEAQPVLSNHRGLKQALCDILNVILVFCTLGFSPSRGSNWRFFKTNTDSMNLAQNVSKVVDKECVR